MILNILEDKVAENDFLLSYLYIYFNAGKVNELQRRTQHFEFPAHEDVRFHFQLLNDVIQTFTLLT